MKTVHPRVWMGGGEERGELCQGGEWRRKEKQNFPVLSLVAETDVLENAALCTSFWVSDSAVMVQCFPSLKHSLVTKCSKKQGT